MEIKFPPMPQTLTEIVQIVSQRETSPDTARLVSVVQRDPAITASVLRRVNSAFYGMSRRVSQIDKAILLLGFKEVCNLVLTSAVKQTFAFKEGRDEKRIYDHVLKTSLGTALYAKELTGYLNLMFPETAFTSGLLHQLGRLVFLNSIPKGYTQLWLQIESAGEGLKAPSVQQEELIFDTDHIRLGAAVAEKWSLPEELVLVIQHSQDPSAIDKPFLRVLAALVAVGSDAALRVFEDSPSDELPESWRKMAEMRNLEVTELAAFLESRNDRVREFTDAMMQA